MVCRKCNYNLPEESVYCLSCGIKQEIPARKPRTRGNGTGTVYKRGKCWEAAYTKGTKISSKSGKKIADRRRKSGFATKREALEYIPILAGRRMEARTASTLSELWDNYSNNAMQKLSNGKKGHYKTAYNKIQDIINIPISEITINDLQNKINSVAPTYYTAKDIKNLLSRLYEMAVAQGDAHANLARFLVLPELEEKEVSPFDEDDIKKLWEDYCAGNVFTAYILLMIYSGMMPGELFKAKKSMINWSKQEIVGCGLKTKKRKETPIVLADIIMPILENICNTVAGEKLISIQNNVFYEKFHATLARCKIKDRMPYACRHTTATALSLKNTTEDIIKEIMRHNNISTTKRYIHKEIDIAPMLDAVNKLK